MIRFKVALPQGVDRSLLNYLPFVFLVAGLVISQATNYLLFHSAVEIFSAMVAVSMFAITWNARKIMKNDYILFLSIAFVFVGIIDFFHALAYKGMGVFPRFDSDLPTQLWIAGRYLLAGSFLAAPLFFREKLNESLTIMVYLGISILLALSMFIWRNFPASYVEGVGQTPFKIVSEYIIILLLLVSLLVLRRYRHRFNGRVFFLLSLSIFIGIVSEMMFTLYIGVYDFFNMLGHFAKFFSYYLVYKAIVEIGLSQPYSLLLREMKQLERRKDEFISMITHELKTPLTSIKGYLQILNRAGGRKHGDRNFELISRANLHADKLDKLITDLLDVTSIDMGRFELKNEEFSVEELVKESIDTIQVANPKHQIIYKGKLRQKIKGDKGRLEQALTNLLTNAVKYSPNSKKIIVGASRKNGAVEISVTDFGIGIPKRKQRSIFEKFYRVPSDQGWTEGLGLGLYVTKEIIERHQGKIWMESMVDKGSTFYFRLPLKERG